MKAIIHKNRFLLLILLFSLFLSGISQEAMAAPYVAQYDDPTYVLQNTNNITGQDIVNEARSWPARGILSATYNSSSWDGGKGVARRSGYNSYIGESGLSFDCSGFVSRVLNDVGLRGNVGNGASCVYKDKYGNYISSDMCYMFRYGECLNDKLSKVNGGDYSDLQPGDILGWCSTHDGGNNGNHIVIYAGDGKMVEFTGSGYKDRYISDTSYVFTRAARLCPSFSIRNSWPCDLTLRTNTNNVEAWSRPGNTQTYTDSTIIGKFSSSGMRIHATRIIENGASAGGHYWYEIVYPGTGETAYVWYKNVDEVAQNWAIHAANPSKPGNLNIGDTFIVSGSAYTDGCMISAIRGFIYSGTNTSGEAEEQSEAAYPNSVRCELSLIDNTMYFNHISTEGYHTYTVKAALHNYHLVDGSPKLEARSVEIDDVTTRYLVGNPGSTTPAGGEYVWFPAPRVYLTQLAYESYSHGSQNAIDISPGGNVFAPFTGRISYMDSNWGYVMLQSLEKVHWANGTYDYMTVGFMHDSDISDLYVGEVITQGTAFYQAGGMGNGNPNAYGTHVHLAVHKGLVEHGSSYGSGDQFAFDAFFVNDAKTSIVYPGVVESGNSVYNNAPSNYSGLWKTLDSVGSEMTSGAGRTIPDGNYIIVSAADPDYYLDIDGNDYPAADNANVTLWGRRSETLPPEDTWTVTYIDDGGFYSIRQNGTNMALDVNDASASAGANVQVYTYYGSNAQKWSISQNNNGSYRIQAKCSGLNLDITAQNIDAGTNIEQWTVHDGAAQQWNFVPYTAFTPCTVTYDANGGVNPPDDQYTTYGNDTVVISAEKPSRASTDAGSFTVTLDANGGSNTTPPLNAQRTTSYSFKDWNSAADGSGDSYTPGVGYTIEKDIALFAQWYANTTTDSVILPTLTRDGYVCRGWATGSTATIPEYTVGSGFVPEGDVTLYAVWEKGILTDWSESKPEGVDESLIETKVQYRYRDRETTISSDPAKEGWTLDGSSLVENGTGSIQYVPSWPSGFDSGHSLYSTYNQTPMTDSETTEISGDSVTGYIYWHWCRGTYSDGPINRTTKTSRQGEWTAFHAFYSTTAPGSLSQHADDGSHVYPNASACRDSHWYYVTEVHTQTYTTFERQNTFYRWTDWSSWDDAEVVSSDNCEVQVRTLYRRMIKEYTITYNPNGGTGAPEAQTKTHGQPLTLSSTVPTRAGYTFLGWAESADATVAAYQSGGEFVKNADTTLYAVWQKNAPDFTLPAALKEIDEEAFANCAFSYVHIPDGVTRIERRAFADCPNLRDVDIPESATSIDPTAFSGTSGLTIHSADGSYAEFFAGKYGFAFVPVA